MLVGTLVNTGAVIAGSLIGLLLGNILPERLRDTVMKGLGLCTLFVGIDGMLGGSNALIAIISMAVRTVIGELCDLDGHLNRFAEGLEKRFINGREVGPSLAEGFVTASLVFCVGAMTIVGALNDGLTGNALYQGHPGLCVLHHFRILPGPGRDAVRCGGTYH